jgi:hypothetical protein
MGDYADLLTAQNHAAERRIIAAVRPEALPSPAAPPPVRPSRRTITRCAFELYQDQLDQLRELALREKQDGGRGSMSAMVREAIDHRLAESARTPA